MKTWIIAAAVFLALTGPSVCQSPEQTMPPAVQAAQSGAQVPDHATATAVGPAPTTQNTVTTTGPVSSETTISVGSAASQVLEWVAATFTGVVGTALTALILKLFKKAGIQISDAARVRLQDLVINGLNASAKSAEQELKGKAPIEIRNATVAKTITYVQEHGAETIKQLGLEPTEQMAVDAIKARIETAVADPTAATPAVMDTPGADVAPKTQAS